MAALNLNDYANQAAQAVTNFRAGTNPHWNDSYLNMGAQLMQQQLENDQQLELWNLMNEYNSPANQMKRFKEAGLNPMLAYTQGTSGNASSTAGYSSANYQLTPQKDRAAQIDQAATIFGMVSNFANSIGSLLDKGMDLQLKRNQVAESNFNRRVMEYAFPYSPGVIPRLNYANLGPKLNPLSESFDPLAYLAFQKHGQLPQFWNNYLTSEVGRLATQFRADYQDYYNKNILPFFGDYQEKKVQIAEIERKMDQYNLDVMQMMPPELRGIIGPLVEYISPFLKFIFKRSSGNFNHNVK